MSPTEAQMVLIMKSREQPRYLSVGVESCFFNSTQVCNFALCAQMDLMTAEKAKRASTVRETQKPIQY